MFRARAKTKRTQGDICLRQGTAGGRHDLTFFFKEWMQWIIMMYLTGGAHLWPSQHASSYSNGCISMQKTAATGQRPRTDWNYCSELHWVHRKSAASIRWGPYNKANAKRRSTARVHLQHAIHYESRYNLPKQANFTTYGLLAAAIANAGPITIGIQDSSQEYHGRRGNIKLYSCVVT